MRGRLAIPDDPSGPIAVPPALLRLAAALAVMMAISLIYRFVLSHLLKTSLPYGFYFFTGDEYGLDFNILQKQSHFFRTAAYWNDYGYPFTYPALVGIIFRLFFKLPHSVRIYLTVMIVALVGWSIVR